MRLRCCCSSAPNCRKLWQLLGHANLASHLAALETRYLDADRHQELATALGVRGLPALLMVKSGQPTARAPADLSVASLLDWLQSAVR